MIKQRALARASERREVALSLVEELNLVERWSAVGEVALCGAVAYSLVVSADIDFEIYTEAQPSIRSGFAILAALAEHPRVTRTRFWNALETPDQGLYWQCRCLARDGAEWKIDVWTLASNHPGPRSSWVVEPLRAALTDDLRATILLLEEARATGATPNIASIDLYRAVLDDGVRSVEDLRVWAGDDYAPRLTSWLPGRSA